LICNSSENYEEGNPKSWNLEPEPEFWSPKSRIRNPETGLLMLRMMETIIPFSKTQ